MEINLGPWLSEMRDHVREQPTRAPLYVLFTLYLVVWYAVTSRRPVGTNIYETDWDLLIVLDACRVDALRQVADEYDFIRDVDSVWSTGSQTAEWVASTFTESWRTEIEQTTYISANGFSESVLARNTRPPANNTIPVDLSSWSTVSEDTFHSHVNLYGTHHDQTYDSVLPTPVTDHTIETIRDDDANRVIAHYTQPHLPYIGTAYREGRQATELERRGYELLEEGSVPREAVIEAYEETLRWVLDDVEELLENVDAERVVITADHGEAFGEWAAYGHPEGFPHPVVRKVPWVETTAQDRRTREPDIDSNRTKTTDIEEHLRDLGYR